MSMPPLATADELATWTGTTLSAAPGGTARAEMLVESASTLVRDHAGLSFLDPDDDSLLDPARPAALRDITLQVAARTWVNPQQAVQESIGPHSITRKSAEVYLNKNEKRRIDKALGRIPGLSTLATTNPNAGAFSTSTGLPAIETEWA